MAEQFKWKGEIAFNGTAKEFAKLTEALTGMVEVEIKWPPGWPPRPFPGYPPWPWWRRLSEEWISKLTEDSPRFKVKWIKDFPGGIRDPHMHLNGEIVLLNRDQFKELVGKVASILATDRVERMDDFISVMAPIQTLEATPIEIPGIRR